MAPQGDAPGGGMYGHMYFVFFPVSEAHWVGNWTVDENGSPVQDICCTTDDVVGGRAGCDEAGEVKMAQYDGYERPSTVKVWKHLVSKVAAEKSFYGKSDDIPNAEPYALFAVNCPEANNGPVELSGKLFWKNPYGYLPAELYRLMPLFMVLAIGFLIMGVVWTIAMVIRRADTMTLQLWVTLVIGIIFLEMTINFFVYRHWNIVGTRQLVLVVGTIFVKVTRQTVLRMIMLVVSMGYGIVRPTLGRSARHVAILMVIYAVADLFFEFLDFLHYEEGTPKALQVISMLPVAVVDALIYTWIFSAVEITTKHLKSRQQVTKLAMYNRFRYMLIFVVVAAGSFLVFQVIETMVQVDTLWKFYWLMRGFFDILTFAMILGVAIIWRPNASTKRYAYAEELGAGGSVPGMDDYDGGMGLDSEDGIALGLGGSVDTLEMGEVRVRAIASDTDPTSFVIDDEEEDLFSD